MPATPSHRTKPTAESKKASTSSNRQSIRVDLPIQARNVSRDMRRATLLSKAEGNSPDASERPRSCGITYDHGEDQRQSEADGDDPMCAQEETTDMTRSTDRHVKYSQQDARTFGTRDSDTAGDFKPGELERIIAREDELDIDHTEQAWQNFEGRFHSANMRVAFTLSATTVPVPGHGDWGLAQLLPKIQEACAAMEITFENPGLILSRGRLPKITGKPRRNDRTLWRVMRRGYIVVMGITVWMQPAFSGALDTNVDLLEVEYSNPNAVFVSDLQKLLKRWGATEALVVSHGTSTRRQTKWPAIACMVKSVADAPTHEKVFACRLCFECSATANAVYAAYLRRDQNALSDIPHGHSISLKPVMRTECDSNSERMIRPNSEEALAKLSKRLFIYGFRAELRTEEVEARLADLGYPHCKIAVQPGASSGTVDLATERDAQRLQSAYGARHGGKLRIGNIRLFVDAPGPEGERACFECGRFDHFVRECPMKAPTLNRQRFQHHSYSGHASNGRRGRASDHWRSIAQMGQGTDVENKVTPSIQELVAMEVKEQAKAITSSVRSELDRHMMTVDSRLQAHENSISSMERAQVRTSDNISEMSSLLKLMAARIGVPDFGAGDLERGTGPQQ